MITPDPLSHLVEGVRLIGNLREDMVFFLNFHEYPKTADHCLEVGEKAKQLAKRFGVNQHSAQLGGWFHDISAVFPNPQRLDISKRLNISILPEEADFPMLLHQKISRIMAKEIFGVDDTEILSAIGCHTTLKAGASKLDKVLFVADKIAWDQPNPPPFLSEIEAALDQSLDAAALVYLRFLWNQRNQLKVLHPWVEAAYKELSSP